MNLREKLSAIQAELKVPKKREMKNKDGYVMYKYRNLDDIFEALKPINEKHTVFFKVDEDIVLCGNVLFRFATASIEDGKEDHAPITAKSFVRENVGQSKVQSAEQLSGGSSSYASKLALSKLLLLDDNQDPDSKSEDERSSKIEPASKEQIQELLGLIDENGTTPTTQTIKWAESLNANDIVNHIAKQKAKSNSQQ